MQRIAYILLLVLHHVRAVQPTTFAGVLEAGGSHGTALPLGCNVIYKPSGSTVLNGSPTIRGTGATTHQKEGPQPLLLKPDVAGEYAVACPNNTVRLYIAVQFCAPGGRSSPVILLQDGFTPADFRKQERQPKPQQRCVRACLGSQRRTLGCAPVHTRDQRSSLSAQCNS